MNVVLEFYEANHFLVLLIVTAGFLLYVNFLKSKKKIIFSFKPKIDIGSKIEIKYILTNTVVEIEIYEGINKMVNNVHFVNHHMPMAVSLLNKSLGDIVKFKKKINDENFIYIEVLKIGDYSAKEYQDGKERIVDLESDKKKLEYELDDLHESDEMFQREKKIEEKKINSKMQNAKTEVFKGEVTSEKEDTLSYDNISNEVKDVKNLNSITLENFKIYLIKEGYREYTPNGNPSTVYDYMNRVENVVEREKINLLDLTKNIDFYVSKYDSDGDEADYGNKSHRAVINALKRFQEYCS
jgi:hypothetical protein